MPYYQCPKCSGRDTYEGTELVSGSTGGDAVIGPENDLGFSPVMKTGGQKTIDQVTVVKCKKCDILLGDKDIYLTAEEVEKAAKEKAAKEKADEKFPNANRDFAVVLVIFALLLILAFILGATK